MFVALIAYDTNRHSRDFNAYDVQIWQDESETVSRPFESRGAVVNNRAMYRGVFSSLGAAAAAVLDMVGVRGCAVVQHLDPITGAPTGRISLRRLGAQPVGRVLASRTPNGLFVSE